MRHRTIASHDLPSSIREDDLCGVSYRLRKSGSSANAASQQLFSLYFFLRRLLFRDI